MQPESTAWANGTISGSSWKPVFRWSFNRPCTSPDPSALCMTEPAVLNESDSLFFGTWDGVVIQVGIYTGEPTLYGTYTSGGAFDGINGITVSYDR